MKTLGLISFVAGLTACIACAHADSKWNVLRETSSNQCHIQASDTRPQRGDLVASEDTKEKACKAAQKATDAQMTDPKKCWAFDKATKDMCTAEKVKL